MSELDERDLSRVKDLVRERFPEMVDVEPSVSAPDDRGEDEEGVRAHRVLIFEKDVSLPDGMSLKRVVRVKVDEAGEIIRLTTSK